MHFALRAKTAQDEENVYKIGKRKVIIEDKGKREELK